MARNYFADRWSDLWSEKKFPISEAIHFPVCFMIQTFKDSFFILKYFQLKYLDFSYFSFMKFEFVEIDLSKTELILAQESDV